MKQFNIEVGRTLYIIAFVGSILASIFGRAPWWEATQMFTLALIGLRLLEMPDRPKKTG